MSSSAMLYRVILWARKKLQDVQSGWSTEPKPETENTLSAHRDKVSTKAENAEYLTRGRNTHNLVNTTTEIGKARARNLNLRQRTLSLLTETKSLQNQKRRMPDQLIMERMPVAVNTKRFMRKADITEPHSRFFDFVCKLSAETTSRSGLYF
ncbi:hypothetical protein Scep_029404 [Stephania cephalantha]|uniref:Uncharacterized protein n=1 Tax=Stephania cephalantha TaxID=152367 RepID=A0AAP0HC71_9MAGN